MARSFEDELKRTKPLEPQDDTQWCYVAYTPTWTMIITNRPNPPEGHSIISGFSFDASSDRSELLEACKKNLSDLIAASEKWYLRKGLLVGPITREQWDTLLVYILGGQNLSQREIGSLIGRDEDWVYRANKKAASQGGSSSISLKVGDARTNNKRKPIVATQEAVDAVAAAIRKAPFEKWSGARVAKLIGDRLEAHAVDERRGREILNLAREINRRSGA